MPAPSALMRAKPRARRRPGKPMMSDCRKGECGLCTMTVVSVDGRIDHRDVFLSEAQKKENHKLCACVSRAVGTIVLDTDDRPDTI
ncbi:MAG: 2Fe-2S iron-sulfur cluster binding domain-containing protein [Rhodoplanes sp.]